MSFMMRHVPTILSVEQGLSDTVPAQSFFIASMLLAFSPSALTTTSVHSLSLLMDSQVAASISSAAIPTIAGAAGAAVAVAVGVAAAVAVAVAAAVAYHDLRTEREGVTSHDLARVFD